MRKLTTAILVALLSTLGATAGAQYQVGPVYPEKLPAYWTAGTNYDPFRLNWGTGRFDYAPIPYPVDPRGPGNDPYRFNEYTGRWDYVPIPGRPTYSEQRVVVDNRPSMTLTVPPPATQTDAPPPDLTTGQSTGVYLRPTEAEWLVRAAERPRAPTTAPTQRQHPAPSIAPTTRPTTSPIVVSE